MYDVVTIAGSSGMRQFLSLPRRVYGSASPARPLPSFEVRRLLDERHNPALHGRTMFLLMARRNGEPVARCSLVLPPHSGHGHPDGSGERVALFGFFEAVDDEHAVRLLFEHVEDLCRRNGVRALHGPFSPTTSGVTGIQLDGFGEANVLYEACSPRHYRPLLEACGCGIERRGRTWRSTTLREDMRRLLAELPERPSRYRIRSVGLTELRRGIGDLASVFDAAFRESWGREAMRIEEYSYVARFLLPAWRPESFQIVYEGDEPVGALLCFPDINPAFLRSPRTPRLLALLRARWLAHRSRSLVTFAMGLHPDYQRSAAGLLLARQTARIAGRYDRMYSTWITEGNAGSERMAARFGLLPWKSFAVFRKDL